MACVFPAMWDTGTPGALSSRTGLPPGNAIAAAGEAPLPLELQAAKDSDIEMAAAVSAKLSARMLFSGPRHAAPL